MVDEEKRLRKQGTLMGRAASGFVGAGAGFTGAWEPLKRETGVSVRKQSPAYKAGWIAGHAVPVPMAHAAKGLKVAKASLKAKKYSKGTVALGKQTRKTFMAGAPPIIKKSRKAVAKTYKKVDRLPLWRAESSISGAGGIKKGVKVAKKDMDTKLEKLLEKQKVAEAKLSLLRVTEARKHVEDEQTMRKIGKRIMKRKPLGIG